MDAVNNKENYKGKDQYGNDVYGVLLPNGTQVWVEVRGKTIRNAGLNLIPKKYNNKTGFKADRSPTSNK